MAPGEWRGLGLRIASALVLGPPVVIVLYLGPPSSDILILGLGGAAAWEWARLCGRGAVDGAGWVAIGTVAAALATGALGHFAVAVWIMVAGAMAATVWATRAGRTDPIWLGLGVVYIAAACIAFLWLYRWPTPGSEVVLWLVAAVWGTDAGAYFAGRSIGGPRLAPSISPKKTWAGLGGGALVAGIVGAVAAPWVWPGETAALVTLSVALALVAQVGDLFESSLKRRFGFKDSSNLIPGHGGVLDRIDGLLAAVLLFGGVSWLTETSF